MVSPASLYLSNLRVGGKVMIRVLDVEVGNLSIGGSPTDSVSVMAFGKFGQSARVSDGGGLGNRVSAKHPLNLETLKQIALSHPAEIRRCSRSKTRVTRHCIRLDRRRAAIEEDLSIPKARDRRFVMPDDLRSHASRPSRRDEEQ